MAEHLEKLLATAQNSEQQLRQRHHVVPRFYLERFAADGDIGVLDTNTGKQWTTGTKDIAVIKDFYMLYDEAGEPFDVVEVNFLAEKVEGPAASVIAKAAAGEELTQDERESLAFFVGIQSVRGQRFPKPVESALVQLLKLQMQMAAKMVAQGYDVAGVKEALREVLGREPTKEDYDDFVEAGKTVEQYEYKIQRAGMLDVYMDTGRQTAGLLLTRNWQVIRFDNRALITGDEPVWLETTESNGPYGDGFGTATAVWMPLDPSAALRMGRPDLEPVDPEAIDPEWLNQGLAGQSHRFLYGDRELLSEVVAEE